MKTIITKVMLHAVLALIWLSYVVVAIMIKETDAEWFAGYGIGAIFSALIQVALFVNWLAKINAKSPDVVLTEEAVREKWAQ